MMSNNIEALAEGDKFSFNEQEWDTEHHWYNNFGGKWKPALKECTYHSGTSNIDASINIGNGVIGGGISVGITTPSYSQKGHKIDCIEGDGNCVNGTDCIPD